MINNNNNLFYLFFVLIQLFSECENIIGEQQTLHQFISKRSLQNKTNISDKFTINPLLTKLPMFNDGKNLENKKEINYIGNVNNTDITISHPSLRLFKNNRKSRRRKDEKFKKQKNSIKKLTPVNDNFNELQQLFNATLFNLAIPLDKENIERKETFKNEERRYFDSYWDNKNSRKLTLEENKEEEQQQIPPFEVTDSLKLALSSTKPTTERRDFLETSAKSTSMLIEQEKLNEEGRLYPWERQRGNDFNIEQPHFATTFIFPSSTPPTLTKPSFSIQQQSLLSTTTHSIMPGAHFYVDQHVSRGRFGREPPLKPTFVYDPNVLQSRYGYNGILSQFLPDGRLQRFGTGIVDHRQSGVVQQKMAVLPSESFSPPSFVFIIPPPSLPPQLPLNMAKAISTNSIRSSSLNFNQSISNKNKINLEYLKINKNLIMTPQGGNSLKWIPLSLKKELEKIIPKITKSVLTTTTIPTTTTTSSPMLCSSGRDIIILSSKGYSLADITKRKRNVEEQERNVLEQNGMTENECIFSCMVNIAKGKTPFECLSATFDLMENKCLLYGPGSSADGSVRLIPNINSIHFEKGCINQNLVNYCNGLPIYRYPQKSLIGYAIGSKYSDTLINCLENCWLLNNDENNNKKCKSVMFYYEENLNNNAQHNCILNSQNHQNIPSNYFVDENEVLVDYATLEGCNGENEENREEKYENNEKTTTTIINILNNEEEKEENNKNSVFGINNIKIVSSKLVSLPSSKKESNKILIPKIFKNPSKRIYLNKTTSKRRLKTTNNLLKRHSGETKINERRRIEEQNK